MKVEQNNNNINIDNAGTSTTSSCAFSELASKVAKAAYKALAFVANILATPFRAAYHYFYPQKPAAAAETTPAASETATKEETVLDILPVPPRNVEFFNYAKERLLPNKRLALPAPSASNLPYFPLYRNLEIPTQTQSEGFVGPRIPLPPAPKKQNSIDTSSTTSMVTWFFSQLFGQPLRLGA